MKVIITGTVMCGGIWYQPSNTPVDVTDPVGRGLIEAGSAYPFETKIVKPKEKKASLPKKSGITSSSLPDPASPKTTVKRPRGRPRKSSS